MSSHWYLQFQYSDTEFVLDFSLFIFVILFSNGKKPGLSFFLLALKKIMFPREFRGGAVVRTWRFHCQGPSSVPGRRTKIPQASRCSQKKKKKKIVFPCLLTFIVYGEKSAIIYIVTPMCAASLFSLAAFKVLSLLLVFSSFDCVGPRSCFLIWGFFVLIFWGLLILDQ